MKQTQKKFKMSDDESVVDSEIPMDGVELSAAANDPATNTSQGLNHASSTSTSGAAGLCNKGPSNNNRNSTNSSEALAGEGSIGDNSIRRNFGDLFDDDDLD